MLIREAIESGRVEEAVRRVNELDSEVCTVFLARCFLPRDDTTSPSRRPILDDSKYSCTTHKTPSPEERILMIMNTHRPDMRESSVVVVVGVVLPNPVCSKRR